MILPFKAEKTNNMISVGTKVCVLDFADFLLQEGSVKKIKDGKATVKFTGRPGEYEYNLDDLEEVRQPLPEGKKKL